MWTLRPSMPLHVCSWLHSAAFPLALIALLSPSCYFSPSSSSLFSYISLSRALSKVCKWTPPLGPWGEKKEKSWRRKRGQINLPGWGGEHRAVMHDRSVGWGAGGNLQLIKEMGSNGWVMQPGTTLPPPLTLCEHTHFYSSLLLFLEPVSNSLWQNGAYLCNEPPQRTTSCEPGMLRYALPAVTVSSSLCEATDSFHTHGQTHMHLSAKIWPICWFTRESSLPSEERDRGGWQGSIPLGDGRVEGQTDAGRDR